jgi:hypothetical protein
VDESDSPTFFCGLTGLRRGEKGEITLRVETDEWAEGSGKAARGQALGTE